MTDRPTDCKYSEYAFKAYLVIGCCTVYSTQLKVGDYGLRDAASWFHCHCRREEFMQPNLVFIIELSIYCMSVATRWRRRRPTSAVQFLDADRRGNVTCDPSPLGVPGGPASSLPLSLSHLAQQRFLLLIDVPLKNAKVVVVVSSEVTELMTGAGARPGATSK